MKYEVVEKATGAKMSHTKTGEMMGSTLFDDAGKALDWLREKGLQGTHEVTPVKG